MSISEEQLRDAEAGLETYKIMAGEQIAPYLTAAVEEENLRILAEYGAANIPGGAASAGQAGFWEISFRCCMDKLKRDPAWKSFAERRADFDDLYNSLPAAEVKQRYESDPIFKRNVHLFQGGAANGTA